MEKLKITILQAGTDSTSEDSIRQICEDPALLELCTPMFCTGKADRSSDATVYYPTAEPVRCPADATEIISTEELRFMPLAKEPTAEDIVKLRDILERDFGIRSPRIAIVQEKEMQNPDLASQVTAEQGINTYGPYSVEQVLADDKACHFDGIVTADEPLAQRIIKELLLKAPVRFFAGRESVVTAACQPARIEGAEEGLADISALTHPIYTAIDVIHNRAFFDEALQNPLPKLYRDKREDRKKNDTQQADTNNDNTEKAS